MLKNTIINKKAIREVAKALGPLNRDVIFVGGAIVSIYINDPAAEDIRPTKDIDISLSLHSIGALELFREKLAMRGFVQSADLDVICRFKHKDILVDVMNTEEIGWAPANRWFAPGFEMMQTVLVEDQEIQIMPLPYFLASKFEAYLNRGATDPRTSHDFEDIVYLFDNRVDMAEQLLLAPDNVKPFLIEQLNIMISNKMKEAVYGNLFYDMREERYNRIVEICTTVLDKWKVGY